MSCVPLPPRVHRNGAISSKEADAVSKIFPRLPSDLPPKGRASRIAAVAVLAVAIVSALILDHRHRAEAERTAASQQVRIQSLEADIRAEVREGLVGVGIGPNNYLGDLPRMEMHWNKASALLKELRTLGDTHTFSELDLSLIANCAPDCASEPAEPKSLLLVLLHERRYLDNVEKTKPIVQLGSFKMQTMSELDRRVLAFYIVWTRQVAEVVGSEPKPFSEK
jgi:hypothetical protein